jgi:hypothetical protein
MRQPVARLRGILLRLTRRRRRTLAVGTILVLPAVGSQLGGGYSAWWAEGLSLVLGATGLALIWMGVTGASPDWIE